MTHAKKDSAGAGQISEKGEADTKVYGKVIPFGPKAGKRGKQGKEKEGIRREKKILDQIEIPFPSEHGNGGEVDELQRSVSGCPQGCPCGVGLGFGCAKDRENKERKEGIATPDH
jgi:hypothetical protein